jgi:hypothetical protein
MLFGSLYRVVENPNEDDAGIEILEGEYKGLVYQYGKVQFVEGKNHLNFQRTIRRLPEKGGSVEELNNNEDLQDVMGDILVELIDEQRKKENEPRITEGTDKET